MCVRFSFSIIKQIDEFQFLKSLTKTKLIEFKFETKNWVAHRKG